MKITTKVTSRNRVTIPAAVVSKLDIKPGTELEWELHDEGRVVTLRLSRYELVNRLQGKWKDLFPQVSILWEI